MTVFLTTTETDTEIVLQWHSTEVGDVVENLSGITVEHPTLLAFGTASLQISDEPPQEFEAPHIIILPLNLPYTFTIPVVPTTIFCVYSKLSGAADEVRHLLNDETIIYTTSSG